MYGPARGVPSSSAAQGGRRAYYVSDNAAGFEAAARTFMGGDLGGAVTLIKPED